MTVPAVNPSNHILELWNREPTVFENVVDWHVDQPVHARFAPLPEDLFPPLREYLRKQKGISQLYLHQAAAWESACQGKNVVVVTSTASGKTLCYTLPVLDRAMRDTNSRALFLFPTKALTQDQYQGLVDITGWPGIPAGTPGVPVAVYDGDTPSHLRPNIRSAARLLLSNPDMLHTGILPHHTRWADFFKNLRFVIIDEIHVYRGVFGSHIANLVRRLKRVAAFYGAFPQFFLTSATISNPGQLAERLIEEPVSVIDEDGSPRGKRHFLLYNPPIINPDLGIRASSMQESIRLVGDLLDTSVQTLVFCKARRTVEMMLMYLQNSRGSDATTLRSYRSGYLPNERRLIESHLRTGEARAVVATNALELGIDIGGMDAVVLVGYPGTIASTRQQAGRAGRKHGEALAVLVASSNPLDQYLMQHPEYIFDRSPEQALINPDNLLILLQHLRCAAFELPFKANDHFGSLPDDLLSSILGLLAQSGEVHASGDRFFWMADKYPAEAVSLRSSSPQPVILQVPAGNGLHTLGEVDVESALWMVHPHAIYLHGGQSYEVENLDLENHTAQMKPVSVDYYTDPRKTVEIDLIELVRRADSQACSKYYGEVMVTTQVVGYRRVRWYSNEILGEGDLELPATQLRTMGYWISLAPWMVDQLRESGLWKSDANNYGPAWASIRKLALKRDRYTCQACGAVESGTQPLHVHHKIPFRSFASPAQANSMDNLVTLCPTCHRQAESSILIRSGLAGLSYVLHNLSPLLIMCDITDLGAHYDPLSPLAEKQPAVIFYDMIAAGIGLSEALYDFHDDLLQRALDLVSHCPCPNGCPSCVGPAGPNGVGGKEETLALLHLLCGLHLE